MLKPHRNTKKAARAREMIASIYHVPLADVRRDHSSIVQMYDDLQKLGFEWVADEQEWLNHLAVDPKNTSIMSFVVGSASHSVEIAASEVIKGLEALGYKVVNTEITVINGDVDNAIARIEVLK